MNIIDTEKSEVSIVETTENVVKKVMNFAFGEKYLDGYREAKFINPNQSFDWLETPIVLELQEGRTQEILLEERVSTSGEDYIVHRWNGFLSDALRISITRVIAERLLKDQSISQGALELIIKMRAVEWAEKFSLKDIEEGKSLRAMGDIIKHDRNWAKWMKAPGGSKEEAESAEIVLSCRERVKLVFGNPESLFPSVGVFSDAIAGELAINMDRGLCSLNEINKARDASIEFPTVSDITVVPPVRITQEDTRDTTIQQMASQVEHRRMS
jgi:hypothetical protein